MLQHFLILLLLFISSLWQRLLFLGANTLKMKRKRWRKGRGEGRGEVGEREGDGRDGVPCTSYRITTNVHTYIFYFKVNILVKTCEMNMHRHTLPQFQREQLR